MESTPTLRRRVSNSAQFSFAHRSWCGAGGGFPQWIVGARVCQSLGRETRRERARNQAEASHKYGNGVRLGFSSTALCLTADSRDAGAASHGAGPMRDSTIAAVVLMAPTKSIRFGMGMHRAFANAEFQVVDPNACSQHFREHMVSDSTGERAPRAVRLDRWFANSRRSGGTIVAVPGKGCAITMRNAAIERRRIQ